MPGVGSLNSSAEMLLVYSTLWPQPIGPSVAIQWLKRLSLYYNLPIAGRDGFMLFSRALVLSETQTTVSRI